MFFSCSWVPEDEVFFPTNTLKPLRSASEICARGQEKLKVIKKLIRHARCPQQQNLKLGKMWRCPGRARQPRATGRAGIQGYGDTGVQGHRVWVLSCSLEALGDVTGEGSKVTGHLRSVPKIKWNKPGPACAKQQVHIYRCHTFAFVLCSYFLTQS